MQLKHLALSDSHVYFTSQTSRITREKACPYILSQGHFKGLSIAAHQPVMRMISGVVCSGILPSSLCSLYTLQWRVIADRPHGTCPQRGWHTPVIDTHRKLSLFCRLVTCLNRNKQQLLNWRRAASTWITLGLFLVRAARGISSSGHSSSLDRSRRRT